MAFPSAGARPVLSSKPLALPPGEVHAWWWDARRDPAGEPGAGIDLLDGDERRRAASFRFPEDRRRWAAGRTLLRVLAARYLDADPRELRFEYGPSGKPRLPDAPLRFNLSRSGDAILLAFSSGPEIGADVERVVGGYDGEEIAGRFFAPREAATLAALPEGIRSEAFFRCWTAKEAYLKGRGDGLGYPLEAFEVPLAAEGPRRLLAHREAAEIGRWWLLPMTPAEGYVSTLAVEGDVPSVRQFEGGRA
jgi:4'-phosphopantetheinyl transferase